MDNDTMIFVYICWIVNPKSVLLYFAFVAFHSGCKGRVVWLASKS